MKINKRLIGMMTVAVMACSTLSTVLIPSRSSIAYAYDSQTLRDAKAQIRHLESSIKTNYLGIKNQATWELYIKNARQLISELPRYEYRKNTDLVTKLNKIELLVNAVGSINHVEKSMQSNYHGIGNAEVWRVYLKTASDNLDKVDKDAFYTQYKSLLQRKDKCESIVSRILESFEAAYFQAVKLHNEAISSSSLVKAESALSRAKNLGKSPRTESLIKEINKLILRLENGESTEGLIIKEVVSVKSAYIKDYYTYDGYTDLEVEFSGPMEYIHEGDFTYKVDGKVYKASEVILTGINRWKIRFYGTPSSSSQSIMSLEVAANPKSYGKGGGALKTGNTYLETRAFKVSDIKFQEGYRSGVNGDEKIEIFFSNDIDPKSIMSTWDGIGSKVVTVPFTINGYNNTDINLPGIGKMSLVADTGVVIPQYTLAPSIITENFKLESATYELTSKNKLTITLNGLDAKYVNAALKFKATLTISNEYLKNTGGVYYNSSSKSFETTGRFSSEEAKLNIDYTSSSDNKISLSNNYGSNMIVESYTKGITLDTSNFNSLSKYGSLKVKLDTSLPHGVHGLYAVATSDGYGRCSIRFYGTAFDTVNYRSITVLIRDEVNKNIGIYPKETRINLTLWTDSAGNLNVYTR
ncbi:hypothetical protein [Clostridium cylindrosporum]|nr:hypothetical protein [Clostridium cylindrosporum]